MTYVTRADICIALAFALLVVGTVAGAAVVDNGDGTATIGYNAPAHAGLDAAVGLGYFEARCDAALVTAGVCSVADGSPLPTTTGSAAMVTQGRIRAALQGQTVPNIATAALFLDYRTRLVLKGYRDRGREVFQQRATTPVDTSDPFEAP